MPVPQKFQFGVVKCSTHTIPQFLDELKLLLADKTLTPRSLLYINAHVYNLAFNDPRLAARLSNARVITADGMAIVWLASLFGSKMSERCNMTEAFRAFLEDKTMPSNTAILIGCTQEDVDAGAANAMQSSTHCKIVKTYSGFLSDDEYRKVFAEHQNVDFIFLGMGTPRTEHIAEFAAQIAPRTIIWAIGGGTIRIYAGNMKEAPIFWRKTGLQWLYRLFEEPKNLWKRYLLGNPLFLWRMLKARMNGSAR